MNFESAFLGPQSIQVCHLRSKTPLTRVDRLRGPPRRCNMDRIPRKSKARRLHAPLSARIRPPWPRAALRAPAATRRSRRGRTHPACAHAAAAATGERDGAEEGGPAPRACSCRGQPRAAPPRTAIRRPGELRAPRPPPCAGRAGRPRRRRGAGRSASRGRGAALGPAAREGAPPGQRREESRRSARSWPPASSGREDAPLRGVAPPRGRIWPPPRERGSGEQRAARPCSPPLSLRSPSRLPWRARSR